MKTQKEVHERDKRALFLIRNYYSENEIIPPYRVIQEMVGYKSINAAFRLCKRLIQKGYLRKIGHRLAPDNLFQEDL